MIVDSRAGKERLFFSLGAISGFLTVALGAFGAHALEGRLHADLIEVFETGVRYQGIHSLALLFTGLLCARRRGRAAPAAGWLFAIGILIFSGSLYALALSGVRVLGAITPIGGVLWLIAWALLALSAGRSQAVEVELESDSVQQVSVRSR